MDNPRILCTEDDQDTSELLSYLLRSEGYEVVLVTTAIRALELARTSDFDLYLLDNWLPELTGVELTRQIRTFDTQTPILFCSGTAQESDKVEAQRAGAQDYLEKPIDTDLLLATISRLIPHSRKSSG
jgi:DNA-binding response OmpR family regulator